jgi:hypothetical protein
MFKHQGIYKVVPSSSTDALTKAQIEPFHPLETPVKMQMQMACYLQLFCLPCLALFPRTTRLQTAFPQLCFLVCLSSRASVFVRPHFSLIFSSSVCLCSLICGAEQHKLTKNWLHSNFSANRTRVHWRGSSARSRLISATSASLRWYFFSYTGRTAGGSEVVVLGAVGRRRVCRRRRGSSLGRNFRGVW